MSDGKRQTEVAKLSAELKALGGVYDALADFKPEERRRILRAAAVLLGLEGPQ